MRNHDPNSIFSSNLLPKHGFQSPICTFYWRSQYLTLNENPKTKLNILFESFAQTRISIPNMHFVLAPPNTWLWIGILIAFESFSQTRISITNIPFVLCSPDNWILFSNLLRKPGFRSSTSTCYWLLPIPDFEWESSRWTGYFPESCAQIRISITNIHFLLALPNIWLWMRIRKANRIFFSGLMPKTGFQSPTSTF